MPESGGQLAESSRERPSHSRRYSPFRRAPGLRRVPDEPIGRAVLFSLVFHAILIVTLVRLTDAPHEKAAADVSAILADLLASAPAVTPAPPLGERPATARSAVARVLTPAAVPSRPTPVASAPTATRQPAPLPPSGIVLPKAPAVSAPAPAEDGTTVMPATSPPAGALEPSAPSTLALETPLDAGWPEPPLPTVANSNAAQPAKTLIPVPFLRDSSQAATGSVSPAAPAFVPRAADPPETPALTAAPAALNVAAPEVTASGPPDPEPSERTVVAETSGTISGARPSTDPPPKPAAPTTPLATVAHAPIAPARSPFGLNLGHALVRLDGPRTWATDQPTRTVSGRVLGATPERLILYVNGAPTDVPLAQRAFEASVPLRPGANELRAVVTGPDGLETDDVITVQYVPRPSSKGIVLTSPPDGLTLGPDDPPIAVVEGEIADKTAATVWIVANDRRISVAASGGRFRQILLLPDALVHLWAETLSQDTVHRSPAVTVRMVGARSPSGVLVMQWPTGTEESSVEVSATWRAHPERLDIPVQAMRLPAASKTGGGAPSDMFYLRGLKPGVYTLIVRYRGSSALGDVRPTLYLPDKDQLTPRALKPVPLNGAGLRVLTKVLMPHAVLWDQEDWFSGRSESVDTVTKFRIPEGISWVERKADLP